MIPSYTSPGDPLKSSWCNDVVSSIRSTTNTPDINSSNSKIAYKPFDPISLKKKADGWYIKLNEGNIFKFGSNEISAILDINGSALSEYEEFLITPAKDLFYNWKTGKLEWLAYDAKGNIKILEITYDGDDFTIKNVHPWNIDLRQSPPFTALLSNTAGSYHVALISGEVLELDPKSSGQPVINHKPTDTEDLSWKAISDGQQASIKVITDNHGTISETSFEVESIDASSTHYFNPCGDDQEGQEGEYHYQIASFSGDFKNDLAGSNIYYTLDVPYIDNAQIEATEGSARVVKEYISAENKFTFRSVKQKEEEPQIKVVENSDDIEIKGNDCEGHLKLTVNGENAGYALEWKDGLIIKDENLDWTITYDKTEAVGNITYKIGAASPIGVSSWINGLTQEVGNRPIPIPSIVAGINISIAESENVYTISASVSGSSWPPDGWEEFTMMVCISGTPTEKIFLTKIV